MEKAENIKKLDTYEPQVLRKAEITRILDSVKNAIGTVNEAAQASAIRKTAYEKGEDIPLTDVVLSMQRSSVAFEATLQIRNKMLKAYEEILRMPV